MSDSAIVLECSEVAAACTERVLDIPGALASCIFGIISYILFSFDLKLIESVAIPVILVPELLLNTAPWAVGSLGRDGGERALRRVHRLGCGPGGGLQVQNRRF